MSTQTHHPEILPEELSNQAAENTPSESQDAQNLSPINGEIPASTAEIPPGVAADSLQNDLQQLKEQLLIAQADFDNFRKRSARNQEEIRRFACANLIEELLPILDNFEIGLKSVKIDGNARSGFQMIFTQLQTLLSAKGLREISAAGVPFDPLQQEAVAYVDHQTVPQEYVVETVRKGYLLNDRLLRPAAVVVSKGKAAEENLRESSEEK
ncbi:MAG: nucleotide exchange factor GrpE [Puniceicoccales bacterium]|jgi:molecular chaperone GrpE|nr:nucleotide exchange factor GrpE [Puniceicoccales bacterium]